MKRFFSAVFMVSLVTNIFAQDTQKFIAKFNNVAPKTVGLTRFPSINNYRYNEDCSGFIAFIFHLAGLNLIKLYGVGQGGVESIWDGLGKLNFNLDENNKNLQVGDIVYFDNTYDKNRNGRWDDDFSHIGVVESIDENQTVTYLHYGSKGVVRSRMNLYYPDTYSITRDNKKIILNDLLRNSIRRGVNPKYLSGALYRGASRLNVESKIK